MKFPLSDERIHFDDWYYRAKIFFKSKTINSGQTNMLDVVVQPIINLPDEQDGAFVRRANVAYLGVDANDNVVNDKLYNSIIDRSNKAFNYIVQSLPDKHLELIKPVYEGNAYALMQKLRAVFGPIKSAVSTVALMMKLNANKKSPTESFNDYFARLERIFHDYANLSDEPIPLSIKKFHLLHGIKSDSG